MVPFQSDEKLEPSKTSERETAQLYRDALLDPELARSLISKMPTNPQAGALHNFAREVKRSLIVGPTLADQSAPTTGATR